MKHMNTTRGNGEVCWLFVAGGRYGAMPRRNLVGR